MQTTQSIDRAELAISEDVNDSVDNATLFDEEYLQVMTEDFFFSFGPATTLSYAAGFSLGACQFLWLADMLAAPHLLSLLRLTRGNHWSYGLMSILMLGVVSCLYLRAKANKTHGIADGIFDGALVVGMACIPTAIRITPAVPISTTAFSLLAVCETIPRIRKEQECPWPELWLPIALAAGTLLKRLSALSMLVVGAFVGGIL